MKMSYPLSAVQVGIYAECVGHEGKPIYNLPYIYTLDPSLDPVRLVQAVETAVAAHPTLFTRLGVNDEGGGGALVRVNSRSGETEILVEEERFAYTWSPEHRNGRFYFEAENDYWSICYDGTGLREEEAFLSKEQKLRKSIEESMPESIPAGEDDRLIDAGDGWYAVLKEPAFYLFRADGSEPEKFEISADDVLVRDEHIYIMQDDYQAERRVYRMVR